MRFGWQDRVMINPPTFVMSTHTLTEKKIQHNATEKRKKMMKNNNKWEKNGESQKIRGLKLPIEKNYRFAWEHWETSSSSYTSPCTQTQQFLGQILVSSSTSYNACLVKYACVLYYNVSPLIMPKLLCCAMCMLLLLLLVPLSFGVRHICDTRNISDTHFYARNEFLLIRITANTILRLDKMFSLPDPLHFAILLCHLYSSIAKCWGETMLPAVHTTHTHSLYLCTRLPHLRRTCESLSVLWSLSICSLADKSVCECEYACEQRNIEQWTTYMRIIP